MSIAQTLKLRLFCEGVEIPVISAVVQSQPNAPAVASIQIPTNDFAMQLKPRTTIHLFFYDFYHGAAPESSVRIEGEGLRRVAQPLRDPEIDGLLPPTRFETSADQELVDQENENYKLLFGGEIVGVQYLKEPVSRAIVLQCMDFSNYWDYIYQYQGGGLFGPGRQAVFSGARGNLFRTFFGDTSGVIRRLLRTPPRNYPELGGTLQGALVHIIEAVGGTYFGDRSIRGINDFASLAEIRLHLTQMVAANPFRDERPIRIGFGGFFGSAIRGLGKKVSIRGILNALQKYIYHDIIPTTAPRYIPPQSDPNLPLIDSVGLAEDPPTAPLARAASAIMQRCSDLQQRLQGSTSDSESTNLSRRRGGLRQELLSMRTLCTRGGSRARRIGIQEGEGNQRYASFFDAGPGVSEAFTVASERFNRMVFLTRRGQRDVTVNTFPSPTSADGQQMLALLEQTRADMERVLQTKHRRRSRRRGQPDRPQRLCSQIYRPDCWMVAPPKCNVFFPELYGSFSYNRQYLEEVSRILLRTHSSFFGSGALFDNWYMAPVGLIGARGGREINRPSGRLVRDLMDHELYTGIIPEFERMSEANLQAFRGGSIVVDGVNLGLAQIAVNHLFFKHRFSTRSLQLSGKFNPFAVLGFPALVIDKYLPNWRMNEDNSSLASVAELLAAQTAGQGEGIGIGVPDDVAHQQFENSINLQSEVIDNILSTPPNLHYFGMPMQLTHSVNAAGTGETRVQMGYARSTNEKTEFFGSDARRRSRGSRRRNMHVTVEVATFPETVPRVGDAGPRGGEIVQVTDVTDAYRRRHTRLRTQRTATGQRFVGGRRIPLWIPGGITAGRIRAGTRVLPGVEQQAEAYGPEVSAIVGSLGQDQVVRRQTLVSFKAYRIKEKLGVYRRETVDIPAEDLTFPPWFGEAYRSNNIGGLYNYFFGCGSVVDAITIMEPDSQQRSPTGGAAPTVEVDGQELTWEQMTATPVVGEQDAPPPGFSSNPATHGDDSGPPGEGVVLQQQGGRSKLEESVERLVSTYSRIRNHGFDVNEFIRSYSWRPVASIVDMFGTANLEINADGETVRGIEGFHSRSFGDYDDLRTLVRNTGSGRPQTILGLTVVDPEDADSPREQARATRDAAISARLDTRKEKRQAVLNYLAAVLASKGLVG